MSQGEKIWFNQMLFFHMDKEYNSNGSLELSISSNSESLKQFSAPNLHLSIINSNIRRVCSLNIQNASDLLISLGQIKSNIDQLYSNNENSILKRYNQNKDLIFKFKTSSNTNEKLIQIEIKINNTDFGIILISLQMLPIIGNIIKGYVTDYLKICMEFQNKFLLGTLVEKIDLLNKEIKILPSMVKEIDPGTLENFNVNTNSNEYKEDNLTSFDFESTEKQNIETLNNLQEFDNFLGENMSNITIDLKNVDIEPSTKNNSIDNPFIQKYLNNDIGVFENIINSIYINDNPFQALVNGIKSFYNFNILPGIDEKINKSISYFSKLLFNRTFKNYIEKGISIPTSTLVIKYKIDSNLIKKENLDLAYDLLIIQGYIRLVKTKLETKISDAQLNKSILFFATRSFADALSFSFFEHLNFNDVKSYIMNRFKSYKENGFFDTYDKLLTENNLSQITEFDMSNFLNAVNDNVIGKTDFIDSIHKQYFKEGSIKIPFENQFNLEQITNEIVKAEIDLQLNNSIKDMKLSNEVSKLFNLKIEKIKETNIVRFIKQYRDEIPEKYRDEVIKYCSEISSNNFDYNKFPIEEFGDDIIKSIYIWNEATDKNEKYTDFFFKYEEFMLDKSLILSKIKNNVEENSELYDDWMKAIQC